MNIMFTRKSILARLSPERRSFTWARYRPIVWIFTILTILSFTAHSSAIAQETLMKFTGNIDLVLLGQNEQDIRDWLDARIKESGNFGLYSWGGKSLKVNGDTVNVRLIRGAVADAAAQLFRAYEMLQEKKYLEAGLKTADFYLAVQQPAGYFPRGAVVYRDGRVIQITGTEIARIQDGYQFRPFALLMYAYKLTGNKKYFVGARKTADFITKRVQNPEWGWCPDEFDPSIEGNVTKQAESHGKFGVRGGGSYNDAATSDAFRMSVIMFHATGNKEYLIRSARLGKWIFATQLGKGIVRGWADSYNANNKPVAQRPFEGEQIDPRNFDRFTGPLLIWFYLITGQEKYAALFKETYTWMRAQEQPDGWAAEFTYDGQPVWTQDYITYFYDKPDTWPKSIEDVAVKDGRPWFSRDKVQLDDCKIVYDLLQKNGRKALLEWYTQVPVDFNPIQYADARKAALVRCSDEQMKVILSCTGCGESVVGKYLERVRLRLAQPFTGKLPQTDYLGRTGLELQSWYGPHTWTQPYRPPYGWASWQYVWDARLALGFIEPKNAASGGRGMENLHHWPVWDVMGDWTTRCIEMANWFDLPAELFIY